MGDFRKAGTDRGDVGREIKHLLISARIRREEYINLIDELEEEDLKFDLIEYRTILEREVMPIYGRALSSRDDELIKSAEEIRSIYEEIISLIESRLSSGT